MLADFYGSETLLTTTPSVQYDYIVITPVGRGGGGGGGGEGSYYDHFFEAKKKMVSHLLI